MGGWVGSGQITKNQINLGLIEIIQFCLKIYDLIFYHMIYDLWIHFPPMGGCLGGLMDGWVNGWGHVKSLKL